MASLRPMVFTITLTPEGGENMATDKGSAALRAFGAYAGGEAGSSHAKKAFDIAGPTGDANPLAASAECGQAAFFLENAAALARAAQQEFNALAGTKG